MAKIGIFLKAAFRYWWLFMGTVALTVIGLIPAFRSQPIPQWLYWLGATICLFFAFFFAWRDENEKAERYKREIDEVYADVVLAFLMERHPTTFPAEGLANAMKYDVQKVLTGLRILEKEFQVVHDKGAIGWSFDAERALNHGMYSNLRRVIPPE